MINKAQYVQITRKEHDEAIFLEPTKFLILKRAETMMSKPMTWSDKNIPTYE